MPAIQTMPVIQPSVVVARQTTPTPTFVVIPSTYNNLDDSPSPGVVVAIVLGSVAGMLLLLFMLYSALGVGPVVLEATTTRTREIASSSVLSLRGRRHSRRHRRPRTVEVERERVVEVREAPVVVTPRVVGEDEVVVVEEHGRSRRYSGRRSRDGRYH